MGQGELREEGWEGVGGRCPGLQQQLLLPRTLDLRSAPARDSMSGSSEPKQNRGSQTEMPRRNPNEAVAVAPSIPVRGAPGAALISKETGALLDPDLGEALAIGFNCDISGHSAVGIREAPGPP